MCRRTSCRTCGKPTWTGCGGHISLVLAGVREEDRCKCKSKGAQPVHTRSQNTNVCVGSSCPPGQNYRPRGRNNR